MPKSKPPARKSPAAANASGKKAVFIRRASSTIGLWVLIGVAVAFESVPVLSVLVALVCVLACAEFFGLLDLKGTRGWGGVSAVALAGAAAHLIAVAWVGDALAMVIVPLIVMAVSCALLFHPIDPPATRRMLMGSVFGVVYTAVLGAYMIRVLHAGEYDLFAASSVQEVAGIYYLLFVLAATKFSDMGAYIVGTAIGSRKFIPHISPGKTWEGILLGAFPFAVLGGCIIYYLFGSKMPALGWASAVWMSVLLGAVAIVGDLAESIIKRCLAKKDSGAVLPGIGGVLDLVDSVLFTAPVFYCYLLVSA